MEDFIGMVFFCSFWIVLLGLLVFWVVMLIDLLKRPESAFNDSNDRLVWILILVLGGGLGALVYFFVKKKELDAAASTGAKDTTPTASQA